MQQGTNAGISGRTQQVQDVILAGIPGVTDCTLVTETHLAAITTLNLSGQGMTALHTDDFAGLTHLQELRLSNNALTTLPAGVFSGLTELTFLFLDNTVLTTLPADVFRDLTALELLYLSNNALTMLPATVFRDLTRLQSLYLSNNALATLPGPLLYDLEARAVAVDLKGNPGYLGSGTFDFCRDADGAPPVTDVATTRGSTPMNGLPRARGRLVQTFKFLKELTELRNPVQRELDDYAEVFRLDSWPMHPCITVRRGDPREEDDQDAAGKELEPIIRIGRATLTPCPKPPQLLKGWLKPGWRAVEAEVDVLPTRNFRDETRETVTVGFSDDGARVVALNNWKTTRTRWVEAERPTVSARLLFEKVYALWTKMQREGDRLELVVADGMLCVEEHLVKHPVLLQRISLDFDPSRPEFRFFAGTEKVELQRALLRLVPTIEGRMIAHFDQKLEAEPVEPLGGVGTEGFLRGLEQGLFNDGEFLEGEAPSGTADRPCLWRDPVIFVRPRTAGLSTTLDYIIEDLEDETTKVPGGLGRIVGVDDPSDSDVGGTTIGGRSENLLDEYAVTGVRQTPGQIGRTEDGFRSRRYFANVLAPRRAGVRIRYAFE